MTNKKKQKKIIVLVSNDLTHDQRVKKITGTLFDMGFDILLLGRKLKTSVAFTRPYPYHRLNLFFTKGAFFYAALNIRFFFYLLFHRADIILANDLDTLLPAFLVSKIKGSTVVYDSHEYFTEAAGLTGRNFQKKVWLTIEEWIFPKIKTKYTVNESIAQIYRDKYQTQVGVVRNIPPLNKLDKIKSRKELGLPPDKKIILLQGAYIDHDRGAKEVALAMKYVENALFLIIGTGQEIPTVKQIIQDEKLEDKILILPKMPFDELMQYTANVDLGLSVDQPLHLNYTLSLPNKLFDYIQAGIPILTSNLPELARVQKKYNIGLMLDNHDPKHIAEKINEALFSEQRKNWKNNLKIAAQEYNWENEEKKIQKIFSIFLDDKRQTQEIL